MEFYRREEYLNRTKVLIDQDMVDMNDTSQVQKLQENDILAVLKNIL